MHQYFTTNTITEIVCFTICSFCLFKEKNPYWRTFIVYLFIVCLTEMGGIHLRLMKISNSMLYAGFLFVECTVVSAFFYHLFAKYKHKITLFYSWMGIFVMAALWELFSGSFEHFPYRTAALMSVVFVIASLYFYMLVIRDENFRRLGTYPAFWIVNGILFFYFGSTACNVFFNYLLQTETGTITLSIRYIVFTVLNILLYGCWSYAFICRYLQRN